MWLEISKVDKEESKCKMLIYANAFLAQILLQIYIHLQFYLNVLCSISISKKCQLIILKYSEIVVKRHIAYC